MRWRWRVIDLIGDIIIVFANPSQGGADRVFLVDRAHDTKHRAADRRVDVDDGFIGFDRDQQLTLFDGLALGDMPFDNPAGFHGMAECCQSKLCCHIPTGPWLIQP